MGSYIYKEGDEPYEFIREVVAKKNRMPREDVGRGSEDEYVSEIRLGFIS